MRDKEISRREFLHYSAKGIAAVAVGLLLPSLAYSSISSNSKSANNTALEPLNNKITAADLIERIKKNVGVTWREPTVDVIKGGGNPNVIVTGITTSFMATLDVLQRSVKAGNNFIITHEPTFWSNPDLGEDLKNDPLYLHKMDFIRKNNLVVFRFHDHWHARKPDGIWEGLFKELGWDNYKLDETHRVFELPEPITLEELAKQVKIRLKSDSVRVIGNKHLKVRTVGMGSNKLPNDNAQPPFADVVIAYEPDRENDVIEWYRDTVLSGGEKGFIIVSHNRLEEAGMDNCARWVRTFVPELPVQFIPSGDPFWRTVS